MKEATPDNVELLEPGAVVAGYTLVRRLGRGGFGLVFLARAPNGRLVALKFSLVPTLQPQGAQVVARVLKEAGLLMRLEHAHVVRLLGYVRWPDPVDGTLVLVMEYVEGSTLREWVRHGKATYRQLAQALADVALALEAAHAEGVMHRDVKASNVLIRQADGRAVLVDFGAGDHPFSPEVTQGALPPGSYRSPEALRFLWRKPRLPGERYPYAPTDDLFALGATFYELLTGTDLRPELPVELLEARAYVLPEAPHLLDARVPAPLGELVMRLLAEWPHERMRSADEVHAAARAALAGADAAWDMPVYEAPTPSAAPTQEVAPFEAGAAQAGEVRAWVGAGQSTPAPLVPARPAPRRSRWRAGRAGTVGLGLLGLMALTGLGSVAVSPRQPYPARLDSAVPEMAHPARLPQADTGAAPPLVATTPAPGTTVPPPQEAPAMKDAQARTQATPSQAPQKSRLRIPTALKAAGCAAGMACTAAQVRPAPADCPSASVAAMRAWNVLGDELDFFIDINQPGGRYSAGTYRAGPITGKLDEGPRELQAGRVWGQLWVTKERIYGRYHTIQLPSGRTVPICLEITDDGPGWVETAYHDHATPPAVATGRRVKATFVEEFH
jgi:serine/threonine-protein kinase